MGRILNKKFSNGNTRQPSQDLRAYPRAKFLCVTFGGKEVPLVLGHERLFVIADAPGIWQRLLEKPSVLRIKKLNRDELIAVRWGDVYQYVGLYRRRLDVENALLKISGAEVVVDLDRIICDRCGQGALMVVQTEKPEVLCRVCAVREQPDRPLPPVASPPDAPATACSESPESAAVQ